MTSNYKELQKLIAILSIKDVITALGQKGKVDKVFACDCVQVFHKQLEF